MDRLSKINEIIPNLYITNWESSQTPFLLEAYHIKAILSVETQPKAESVKNMYKRLGIDHMQIFILDLRDENISRYFDETYQWIDSRIGHNVETPQNVLVHCYAGISRSVTIVLNYLIKRMFDRFKKYGIPIDAKMVLDASLQNLRMGRPMANPNPGFMAQLLAKAEQYEKETFPTETKMRENYSNTSLNIGHFATKAMCDKNFVDIQGKQANVICLTSDDFDENGNLPGFKNVVGVVFFHASWCGHCQHTKPEYVKFASMLNGTPARAFAVDGEKNKDLLARINENPSKWGYMVKGFPMIVGYAGGKFFSEYGYDETNPKAFRTAEDLLAYAKGLGQAPVQVVPAKP